MDPIHHAQIVQEQLTLRIAKRLDDFVSLPFIVGCNPYLKKVMLMYADAFKKMRSLPKVVNKAQEAELTRLLTTFLDDHSNVLELMANGCRECSTLVDRHILNSFMDRTMFSRIGIRLLVEHHLSLSRLRKGYIGSIGLNQRLSDVAKRAIKTTTDMCVRSRGIAPRARIEGNVDTTFTYTTAHVEYILGELLKNSFRATVERHGERSKLPDVVLTLARNDTEIIIRVSDQGGGFPNSLKEKIWGYAVTTIDAEEEMNSATASSFGNLTQDHTVVLAGQGVGLPVARTYAEYFDGSLELKSRYGHGVDAFLTLSNLHKDATHLVIH